MDVKIVYSKGTISKKLEDESELEKLINDEVITVVINGEMYYKLGEKFYHIPIKGGDGKYLALLNKYKQKDTSFSDEKDYPGENA